MAICSIAHIVSLMRLYRSLKKLNEAIGEVNAELEELRKETDPLAAHIFLSRRAYGRIEDGKSWRRRDRAAWESYREASRLGFRGNLEEWRRLLGAYPKGGQRHNSGTSDAAT